MLGLEHRRQLRPSSESEWKEQNKALAQSYTSLGNLHVDMAKKQPSGESRDGLLMRALEYLVLAKTSCVMGFSAKHPKVAWALEGQANLYRLMGNYHLAIESIDEAIDLRKAVQQKSEGKALFSRELEANEQKKKELEQLEQSQIDEELTQHSVASAAAELGRRKSVASKFSV